MRRFLRVCSIALLVGPAALAAETPESLVQKLGSPRYAERESASRELLKLGVAALPAVKAAAETSPDAEVRERAISLLESLSLTNDSSKLLAVKPIKIEFNATPLSSAIAAFKAKTGIPLQLVPGKVADATRPVTVPAGEYAPWEALEVLLKAAGLREDHRSELPAGKDAPAQPNYPYGRVYYGGEVNMAVYTPTTAPILLVDGSSENLPAVRSGGVRITALPPNFAANRVIRGAGRVIFHLDAAPVPATGWHSSSGVRITTAEDEDGRPVFADLKLQNDNSASNPYDWNGRWGWGGRRVFWGGGMMFDEGYGASGNSPYTNPRLVAVSIRTNDRALTKLRNFEGVVLGEVHIPNVPIITVDDLEKGVGVAHSGPQQSTFQINEAKKQKDGSYTVKLRHEALTQWALQMMRGGGGFVNTLYNDNPGEILNRIKYYDAEGKELKKPLQENQSYTGDGFRQSVEVTLRFPKTSKPPAKLVVTGTRITPVEVPFKLINVRVP